MKLTVYRKTESNLAGTEIASTTSERRARQIATRESARGIGQIYISWFRPSDGQEGYLNRDGHGCTGKAW